ncbi:Mu-like prophage major head subunit gpT family protein [Pseudogemmobacter bohemicus]|uniref:Mu-like prophage major head subunit gpT family protein n=1 Tax=Pseudogemmobacter bohemicus TaxID=2250708 RepID=UPI000DD4250A|nr:Mu-like prophage major head subunit gpT family protein [Pseudogemmobacter bohemicus]
MAHAEGDGRAAIKGVMTARYTLENRKFESTIRVRREDIEDDRLGVYSPQISMMAHAAASHPDELVFEVLKKGFTAESYDGHGEGNGVQLNEAADRAS